MYPPKNTGDPNLSLMLDFLRGGRKDEARNRQIAEVRSGDLQGAKATGMLIDDIEQDEAEDPDLGVRAQKRQGQYDAALDFFRPDIAGQRHEEYGLKTELATAPRRVEAQGRLQEQALANQGAIDRQRVENEGILAATRAKAGSYSNVPAMLKERLASAGTALDTLDKLEATFNPSYVGPVAGRWNLFQQKIPLVPSDPAFAEFSANSATLSNSIIKAITGAQMSEPEALRILRQVPTERDKPEVWAAKARSIRENLGSQMENIQDTGNPVSEERLLELASELGLSLGR